MSGFATSPAEAETAYVSRYPFAVTSGFGISLACTTTSTSATALTGRGTVMTVTNIGSVTAMLAFGISSMGAATTSYYPILPGTKEAISIDPDSVTHVRGITVSGSTTILIHKGFGN